MYTRCNGFKLSSVPSGSWAAWNYAGDTFFCQFKSLHDAVTWCRKIAK